MTPNEALQAASDALRKASEDKQNAQDLVKSIGPAVVEALKPTLEENGRVIANGLSELAKAISELKIAAPSVEVPKAEVTVTVPEIIVPTPIINVTTPEVKIPDFPKIPPIKVPKPEITVNVPEIKIPDIIMPDEMDVKGWVGFMGFDKSFLKNPLPVQLRDSQGNPVKLFDNLTQVMSGGGGGGLGSLSQVAGRLQVDVISQPPASASVTIADIFATTQASVVVNPDNRVRVELPAGSSGLTDTELRASHLDVQQISGAIWSVSASLDTTLALFNGDNRLRVSVETGGSGLTDAELRASHLDVVQMSGTIDSVFVTGIFNSTSADILTPDNRLKTDGSGVTQPVSGTVTVQDALTTTSATQIVNADNRIKVELPATTIAATQSGAWDVDNSGTFAIQVQDSQASTISSHIFNTDFRGLDVYVGGTFGTTISDVISADNRVKVDGSAVTQPVSVTDIFATSATSNVVNTDNRVKVELPATTITAVTDVTNSVRILSLPETLQQQLDNLVVRQVSGFADSVNLVTVSDIFSTTVASTVVTPDNRVKVDGSGVTQPISVTDIFATTASSNVVNADNRIKVELPATTITAVTTVGSVTNTVIARLDSPDGNYSSANPLPITLVSGALTSTVIVGATAADVADDGNAPIQIGGIARTGNPTPVAANDVVKSTFDTEGRQVMRLTQIRDLIATAYVSLTNGTETTLLAAGGAGVFHDMLYILGANNSDAAVMVDIRDVTGGNVVQSIEVPPYGTAGVSTPVPYPQGSVNNNWTVDMPDITGTTVNVTALFTKEV